MLVTWIQHGVFNTFCTCKFRDIEIIWSDLSDILRFIRAISSSNPLSFWTQATGPTEPPTNGTMNWINLYNFLPKLLWGLRKSTLLNWLKGEWSPDETPAGFLHSLVMIRRSWRSWLDPPSDSCTFIPFNPDTFVSSSGMQILESSEPTVDWWSPRWASQRLKQVM